MTKYSANEAINRVMNALRYSLASYLRFARPWAGGAVRVGFSVLLIVAGLDKFFQLLVNWDQYFVPPATQFIPVSGHTFMLIIGAIEIAVGLLVAFRPRFGAYVGAVWLWGMVFLMHGVYDAAMRDFTLSLATIARASLSAKYGTRISVAQPGDVHIRNDLVERQLDRKSSGRSDHRTSRQPNSQWSLAQSADR